MLLFKWDVTVTLFLRMLYITCFYIILFYL